MSDVEKSPVDPFAAIDLDSFKQEPSKIKAHEINIDKEKIKKAAVKSNFNSRQIAPKKQKLFTKTFSLFQEEMIIIKNALKAYDDSLEEEFSSSSHSDAVRAGLHLLAEKKPEEQAQLILMHRGRGRK